MAGGREWTGMVGKGFTEKVTSELKFKHWEGILQTGKELKGIQEKARDMPKSTDVKIVQLVYWITRVLYGLCIKCTGGCCGSWRRGCRGGRSWKAWYLDAVLKRFNCSWGNGSQRWIWGVLKVLRKLSGVRKRQNPGSTYSRLENTADDTAWCLCFFLIETNPYHLRLLIPYQYDCHLSIPGSPVWNNSVPPIWGIINYYLTISKKNKWESWVTVNDSIIINWFHLETPWYLKRIMSKASLKIFLVYCF